MLKKIYQRFEKGNKFLDLRKFKERGLDGDLWDCCIWENGKDLNEHCIVPFSSKGMAMLFITNNGWIEQHA